MPTHSQVSHLLQDAHCVRPYLTGVSLHSHTSLSIETLNFVEAACASVPFIRLALKYYEHRCRLRSLKMDFSTANWRPPLLPRMAYDLEEKQIQDLGLKALVSITDHDSIQAPLLLRNLPSARGIPVSTEWTAPFGKTAFHLGIHNLPSADALAWMARFEAFTAAPTDDGLHALLTDLNAVSQVLIVLNHPMWDLHKIGAAAHNAELDRFLHRNNALMHAFELNGLRHNKENRLVAALARTWDQLLLSGGDRHGLEPNANINLTSATNFTDFVHEIRVERRSHICFMPQYSRPWERRILESTLDAISDHAHFSPGWQRWDDRAFHKDVNGTMRSLADLWPDGTPPIPLTLAIKFVRLFRSQTLARTLSLAFPGVNEREPITEGARDII